MGMSSEQYWDDDPALVIYYRRAEEFRNEKRNQELWLQGMYIYEAIADLAPILHAFAKKGAKAKPYPSQPYALTTKEKERSEERQAKVVFNKARSRMEALMASMNKKFGGEDVSKDVDHN